MSRKSILFVFLLSCILESCTYESEGIYTDDRTEEYELYDYYVDSYGNEGIVAFINKGYYIEEMIVISADESYEAWGPMGECVFNADTINKSAFLQPEFGVAMHQSMKSIGIESFPAQAWCDKKNQHEKYCRAGSWRLPTLYELKNIFGTSGKNVNKLNSALLGIGAQPLDVEEMYWTCVEDHDDYVTISGVSCDYDKENRAVIISPKISTYSFKERWLKKNKHNVRAIKYVYYSYDH